MKYVLIFLGIICVFALIEYIANWYQVLKSRSRSSINNVSNDIAKPIAKRPEFPNCLTYKEGNEEYKARFENGVVYRVSKYTDDYIIGYYDKCESGDWKVKCVYDKGEIGTIMPDSTSALVSFNRLGDLARHREMLRKLAETNSWLTEEEQNRQHSNVARNTKLTWMCAEAFEFGLQDLETFETIATSTGKDFVGAAAAFICLQYEVVTDGKYHSFFKAIN